MTCLLTVKFNYVTTIYKLFPCEKGWPFAPPVLDGTSDAAVKFLISLGFKNHCFATFISCNHSFKNFSFRCMAAA